MTGAKLRFCVSGPLVDVVCVIEPLYPQAATPPKGTPRRTLKQLGASPSTKVLIPTEFMRLAEQIGGYVDRGMTGRPAVGDTDAR